MQLDIVTCVPLGGADLPWMSTPGVWHFPLWNTVALTICLGLQVWGAASFLRYFAHVKSESESGSVVPDSLGPRGLYSPWNSPGQNTGVGSLSFLQWIFPTQGLSPRLLHYRQILFQLSYQGSPNFG